MDALAAVRDDLVVLEKFVSRVEAEKSRHGAGAALLKVRPLVRLARNFYIEFFREVFRLEISGFSFRDKRDVSRRLVREEQKASNGGANALKDQDFELAELYEALCDILHGDIEFGYGGDQDDYRQFHATFPNWLYAISEWARERDEALARKLKAWQPRYEAAVARGRRGS